MRNQVCDDRCVFDFVWRGGTCMLLRFAVRLMEPVMDMVPDAVSVTLDAIADRDATVS